MNKMGSPWPWTQEPVKATEASGGSLPPITHNNNNNHQNYHDNNQISYKGENFDYHGYYENNSSSFYNNHVNHENYDYELNHQFSNYVQPTSASHYNNHHHQHQHHHQQQQLPSSHPLPPFTPRYPVTSPTPMITPIVQTQTPTGNGDLHRRRTQQQPEPPVYFTFEETQLPHLQQTNNHHHYHQHHHPPPPPPHHHHQPSSTNNGGGGGVGNYPPPNIINRRYSSNSHPCSPSPSPHHLPTSSPTITTNYISSPSPLTPFSSSFVNTANNNAYLPKNQSQFVTAVKEIPTWNRYYSDQKHRIIDFTDKNNSIRPDSFINQLVSLCFVDTCITNLAVDAIVNSTTEDYSGCFGVDKLIHHQAGRNLREACKSLPRLSSGQAEMTLGFQLPAKYVIHTNGPFIEDTDRTESPTDQTSKDLMSCYINSFNFLLRNKLRTIAFPCISTGIKRLSKRFAAEIALRTVRRFLEEHKHSVDRVIFCLHHQKDIEIYLRYMQIYFPVEEPPPQTITIT